MWINRSRGSGTEAEFFMLSKHSCRWLVQSKKWPIVSTCIYIKIFRSYRHSSRVTIDILLAFLSFLCFSWSKVHWPAQMMWNQGQKMPSEAHSLSPLPTQLSRVIKIRRTSAAFAKLRRRCPFVHLRALGVLIGRIELKFKISFSHPRCSVSPRLPNTLFYSVILNLLRNSVSHCFNVCPL